MEWGTVADWVSAVGGLLAVVAAIVAWRVSQRLFDLEKDRDDQRQAMRAREQAELVYVLGARLPDRSVDEIWAIAVYNESDKPIFDVVIESQRLDGSVQNYDLKLGAVPPGRFVVPSHPKFHWGSLIDLDRTSERIEFLVRGKGNGMIQSVQFRDAAREGWQLQGGTRLTSSAP